MTKFLRTLTLISLLFSAQVHAFGISWSNNKVKEVAIKTGLHANLDFPLPVDIVLVMDENVAKGNTFSNLSNKIYFQDKKMLHMQCHKSGARNTSNVHI